MRKEYKVIEIKKTPNKLKRFDSKNKLISNKNVRKTFSRLFYWSLMLIPAIGSMYIIAYHSNYLLKKPIEIILLILTIILLITLISSGIMVIRHLNEEKKSHGLFFKIFHALFFPLYIGVALFCLVLFYKPVEKFKTWLVTTAMTTMKHQYLAKIFYSDYDIKKVLNRNKIIEINENTDSSLVNIEKSKKKIYESEDERFILEREKETDHYKIVDIEESTAMGIMRGKMVIVYDPSKLFLGVSKYLGNAGETVQNMVKRYDAAVGINGGGFIDPNWNSNGGIPHGIVFSKGNLVANNAKASVGGGLVGLSKDGKLILGRYTVEQAKAQGIRDAVEFGPFLIVNGKTSYIQGNGGWGWAPRTVVGQRADGIILLMTIDGRQPGWSNGAGMQEVTRVMLKYRAVNAACMDGGTSTNMADQGGSLNRPSNGKRLVTRRVPNAWIVAK